MATTSAAAALKIAAVCMVLAVCVGSDLLVRPALAASCPEYERQEAAAGALVRELLEHELAEELGLLITGGRQHGDVGAVCTPACQNCLIICAITCVLNTDPAACFANCTVTNDCFSKPLLVA